MLGRVALSQACGLNDEVQTAGIEDEDAVLLQLGVDPRGIRYVAEQRALRAGLLFEGWSEVELDLMAREGIRARDVHFSPEVQAMLPVYAAIWIDGVKAALRAQGIKHLPAPETHA